MSSGVFIDFRPAELVQTSKETYVSYYVKEPATGKLKRMRVRLNHIHGKRERVKYGRALVQEINDKLYAGWNPLIERDGASRAASVGEAAALYGKTFRRLRKATQDGYGSSLRIFREYCDGNGLLDRPVVAFDARDAQRYMLYIEDRGASPSTYNNHLVFMRQMFNFCVERGLAGRNPFCGIKRRRVDRKRRCAIPEDVLSAIWAYIDGRGMVGYRNVCLLTYKCLLRPKEALMLEVRDIDATNGLLRVRAEVAKNHCERIVALPDDIRGYMEGVARSYPSRHYVFSRDFAPGERMLTTRDTGRVWTEMRKALGLDPRYQFYSLKDTGVTRMLEAGAPAKLVQELAGHHSIEMTQRYVTRSGADEILKYSSTLK